MKAVIVTCTSTEALDRWLIRRKRPNLAWLVSSLEKLGTDEVLIAGENTLKGRFSDWFEKERGRFGTPLTLRFQSEFAEPWKIDSLIRLIRHESLEDAMLLLSLAENISFSLAGLKKAFYLHPYSPVIGVRKPATSLARAAISIGERNRITRFSATSERLENEWEPAGTFYFPARFLSDSLPAFMKSRFTSHPAFESFLSWSVRNFKVYAHVFAAHPGL